MSATTIKVSSELRDRLNAVAAERGLTAGSLVEKLLDDMLWQQQVELAAQQMRDMTPEEHADYMEEFRSWDRAITDEPRD